MRPGMIAVPVDTAELDNSTTAEELDTTVTEELDAFAELDTATEELDTFAELDTATEELEAFEELDTVVTEELETVVVEELEAELLEGATPPMHFTLSMDKVPVVPVAAWICHVQEVTLDFVRLAVKAQDSCAKSAQVKVTVVQADAATLANPK